MPKELNNYEEIEGLFKEEIAMILDEIRTNENLYEELKVHFDKVKNSSSPGALTFISKQTPSLISARNNKISLLKDLVAIKKIAIDSSLKIKSNEDEGSKENAILAELHKMLVSNNRDMYVENYINQKDKEEEIIEEINYDKLLEDRLNKINNESNSSKNNSPNIEIFFVIDSEKNIYAIDEDYNLIEDDNIEYPDWIIKYDEDEDGNLTAYNQYGEELTIVDFEED